jgi:hypothetical protein
MSFLGFLGSRREGRWRWLKDGEGDGEGRSFRNSLKEGLGLYNFLLFFLTEKRRAVTLRLWSFLEGGLCRCAASNIYVWGWPMCYWILVFDSVLLRMF